MLRSGKARIWLILAAILPAFLLSGLALRNTGAIAAFRDLIFDSYLRAHPRPYNPALPVRVIDIDDESLKRHGQWPWPRPLLAQLVTRLHEAGAAAIAFDILMAEPDRFSPEQLAARLSASTQKEALNILAQNAGQTHDEIFAQAIATGTVISAVAGTHSGTNPVPSKYGFAFAGDKPHGFLPQMRGAILPLDAFIAPSAGLASLNFFPDRDLVVRRAPTLTLINGAPVPGLAMEALRVAQQATTFIVKSSNASGETAFGAKTGVISVKVGEFEIPTEPDGAVRVHYAGTQAERRISAWKILAEPAPDILRGAIVFVGSGAAGMDIRATPLDAVIPGIDVHAELTEHILGGARLARPDYANGLEAIAIILAGLVAAGLVLALRAAAGAMAAGAAAVSICAASWFSFVREGLLFDPVLPSLALLSGFGLATVLAYRTTEKDRARIRDAFGRYVSPAIVETLASDPSRLKLGGDNRDVTVLFTDIRNFTGLAERLPAEQVVQFLNAVHTPMTNAVIRRNGTIDKYIGDGLMAFWNAPLDDPDHVRNALRAALDMVRLVPDIPLPPDSARTSQLQVGIGIHTGQACVGNLGSSVRFDYSIVGDTVNSAARLEPLSKHYGVAIVVGDTVADAAPDFAFVKLDEVHLRGRQSAMRIYALVGDETVAASDMFKSFAVLHNEALAACNTNAPSCTMLAEKLAADTFGRELKDFYAALAKGEFNKRA